MADGDVAVHAHGGQREGAGEHVVIVDGDDRLAQGIAERPEAQEDVGALEGQGQQHQGVCQGQVKDVNVGGRLHLGVSAGRLGRRKASLRHPGWTAPQRRGFKTQTPGLPVGREPAGQRLNKLVRCPWHTQGVAKTGLVSESWV